MMHDSIWVGPHFQAKEFKCDCCSENVVHPKIVHILENIREDIGAPLRISSGVRCPSHNKNVGGAAKSFHQPQEDGRGYAADFTYALSSMKIPINIVRLFLSASEHVGDGGAILYPSWVHIDCRDELSNNQRYRSTSKFPWPRL